MKRLSLILAFLFYATISYAQSYEVNIQAVANKKIRDDGGKLVLLPDETFTIREIEVLNDPSTGVTYYKMDIGKEYPITIGVNNLTGGNPNITFQTNKLKDIWDTGILYYSLPSILEYGWQPELRRELEDEALQFIYSAKSHDLEFNDPYLESYIYSLVNKIVPDVLLDNRQYSVNVFIMQDPSINAYCYPNGTIVINTGLLAALHSEAELVAILSHEIAHYVLDHSVANINETIEREQRAAFWSAFITGVAAVGDGILASKYTYYQPGVLTGSAAILSSTIAANAVKRLGMEYNHSQENIADEVAQDVLRYLGYDENALATALSRLEDNYVTEKDASLYVNSSTHPSLYRRIKNAGTPSNIHEKKYEQLVSFAVTNTAIYKFNDRRFKQCLPLVNQNIVNNVATADDYIIKARCLLAMDNSQSACEEILHTIEKAKELNANKVNIYKTEIMVYLRLEDYTKAIELLSSYYDAVNAEIAKLSENNQDLLYKEYDSFLRKEMDWASNMLIKIRSMSLQE